MNDVKMEPDADASDAKSRKRRRRRRRRWLVIGLVVSLGINVFAIGWAGARWAIYGAHEGWRFGDAHPAVAESWRQHGPAVRSMQLDAAAALREAAGALETEPFDQVAYDQALAKLAGTGREFLGTGTAIGQELGGKLAPDERNSAARAARRLARRLERWGKLKGDHWD